jgi:hypothetical protein
MSDHNTPDPLDQAYVQAEGLLDDEAARVARRARVLGAVAGVAPARKPQVRLGRGAWLAAACVAGAALVLAVQLTPLRTVETPGPAAPPIAEIAPSAAEAPPAAPTPVGPAPVSAPPVAEAPVRAEARTPEPARAPAPVQTQKLAPAPAAPPPVAAPASPMAFPASDEVSDVVIVGRRAEAAPKSGVSAGASAGAATTTLGARLRLAAAAGRTAEVTALLAEGAPVDEADSQGETALMKSVQANRPAVAAVLRREGANLDLRNREGVSARDMAVQVDDVAINRALGLRP